MISTGDIWLVDFGDPYPREPAYRRPALVVGPVALFGNDFPYRFVVPLTTTARGINLHVEMEPSASNGLTRTSYVQCELHRSVAVSRFGEPLGVAGEADLLRVRAILARLLGFAVRSA